MFTANYRHLKPSGCKSGDRELRLDAWLFDTEKPNLFQEKPLGEVFIDQFGKVRVHKGAPPNWEYIVGAMERDGFL
jgi:hypothetical protein